MECFHICLHLNWGHLRILLTLSFQREFCTQEFQGIFFAKPQNQAAPLTQSLVVWSLNHRMTEVGRHLWRMPSQTPLLAAGQLKLAVQGCVWFSFEDLQEQRLHNFSGQHAPVLGHPCSKAACSYIKIEFLIFQCVCKKSSGCWASHQRRDHLDSLQSLAACDKSVPKFPVV